MNNKQTNSNETKNFILLINKLVHENPMQICNIYAIGLNSNRDSKFLKLYKKKQNNFIYYISHDDYLYVHVNYREKKRNA